MKTKSARPQKKSSFTTIDIHLSRNDSNVSSASSSASSSSDGSDEEKKKIVKDNFDAKAYLDNRVMSPVQEACNALSMVPQMIFSAYFVLSGSWAKGATYDASAPMIQQQQSNWITNFLGDEYMWTENSGCIDHPMFPLTALPPPPVMMVGFAGIVHPIFSILFHYNCMTLEP